MTLFENKVGNSFGGGTREEEMSEVEYIQKVEPSWRHCAHAVEVRRCSSHCVVALRHHDKGAIR